MRTVALALIFGVVASGIAGRRQTVEVDNFSDLRPGEIMKIEYGSSGCFHQDRYELEYRAGSRPVISVLDVGIRIDRKPIRPAILPLSSSDVHRLDRLLAAYRTNKHTGCTTIDTITFIEVRGGHEVARERRVDSSCAISDSKDVLSLRSIVAHARSGGLVHGSR